MWKSIPPTAAARACSPSAATPDGNRSRGVSATCSPAKQPSACALRHFTRGFSNGLTRSSSISWPFLVEARRSGTKVAAYGAAAKGNTLLNYTGVRPDLLPYVVDRNPAKQGKYLPGSRIPIVDEEYLRRDRPHRVVILPWNLREEVVEQLAYIGDWGGKFVLPIPALAILN